MEQVKERPIGIGHNNAPLREVLQDAHGGLIDRAAELVALAEDFRQCESDTDAGQFGDFVKHLTAHKKAVEATRVAEKEEFLIAARDVDGFFLPSTKRLDTEKARLERILGVFLRAKADAERRVREAEARAKFEEVQRLQRERQEAEAAARPAVAERVTEALIQARDAARDATAKPAALARTRGDQGSLVTLRTQWVGHVIDPQEIDLNALRPYFGADVIQKAIDNAVRSGVRELAGVSIVEESKAVVR